MPDMRSIRELRGGIVASVLASALSVAACAAGASSFSASGTGAGDVLIWLTSEVAAIEVDAALRLEGSLPCEGQTLSFTVEGTAIGTASVDAVTLETRAWIVVDAAGTTTAGEPIRVRGGFLVTEIRGDLTGSSGGGAGRFDLAIVLPGQTLRAVGTLTGTAAGQFVPSEVAYAMQASGSANLELEGLAELAPSPGEDPVCRTDVLDADTWPTELAKLLGKSLETLP